jgi:uncharacterized membrane protein YkvA (DUF1232 family)
LNNEVERDRFLGRLKKKLVVIPKVGKKLARITTFAELLYDYFKGVYREIPIGSILSLIACLIYFVSTIDIVPDVIPFFGYFDDGAVLALCWKWIGSDVMEYEAWKEEETAKALIAESKENSESINKDA